MIRRLRARLRTGNPERGMTLVELLVYMILLGIVLGIIASVLINSLQKQREVVGISEANNTGQTVISAIDLAVLNASSLTVKPGAGGSVLLITKTRSTLAADDPNVARCVGFYYDAPSRTIHTASDMLSGSPSDSPRTRAAYSSPAAARSWPVLAEGIELNGAKAIFANPAKPGTPVTYDLSRVETTFNIKTLDPKPPVTFQVTSGVRGSGAIDNKGNCW